MSFKKQTTAYALRCPRNMTLPLSCWRLTNSINCDSKAFLRIVVGPIWCDSMPLPLHWFLGEFVKLRKTKMHLQIWEEGRLLDTERFLCLNFTHVVTTCRILSRWTQRTKEIDKSVYLCSPSKEVASSCATRTGRKKKRKKDKYRYYWYCHSSTLNHLW